MPVCSKCCTDLPDTQFSRNKRSKNGLCVWCKTCSSAYQREYRKTHSERLRRKLCDRYQNDEEFRERVKERARQHYAANPGRKAQYDKRYFRKNRERIRKQRAEYYRSNSDKIKQKTKQYALSRYKRDPRFVTICRLRHRLREAFKRYSKNGKVAPSADYGIDWQAILEHLGPCPGNVSEYHIDHIVPLSSFDHDDPVQVRQAWAPENHQWLLAADNRRKHTSSWRKQGE